MSAGDIRRNFKTMAGGGGCGGSGPIKCLAIFMLNDHHVLCIFVSYETKKCFVRSTSCSRHFTFGECDGLDELLKSLTYGDV